MSIVDVGAAPPDVAEDGPPNSRPRRRRWLAVAIVVVLIGALSAVGFGVRWRANYQPLAIDDESVELGDRLIDGIVHPGGWISGSGVWGLDVLADDDADDDADFTAAATYHDGDHLVFGFALHNSGSVGVTITGFDLPRPEQVVLLGLIDVRIGKRLAGGGTSVVHTDPFRPFTLHSGETRDVVVREKMRACEWNTPGSGNTWSDLGLHYRTLGLTRHATLPAPVHITVMAPPAADCPRPARYNARP